jgi:hypothetical protein
MADKRMASFRVKQAQHRFERLRVLWQQCSIQRELSITPVGSTRQYGRGPMRSARAAQSIAVV